MNWITGLDRNQQHLLPEQLEDYVTGDNPVRFLDAFVEKLDLAKAGFLFPKQHADGRGRPGYHPKVLLKLYLYGYLNQIRSSRRLESECKRNLEMIWLMGKLQPDFKTIADFRKDNASAFKAVVREFTRLCRELGLFGAQLTVIDGTKIKAQNALDQNWTEGKLQRWMARIDESLAKYLNALEEADGQDGPRPSAALKPEELKEKIRKLEERKSQIQERLQEMKAAGVTEISATDPDSRAMVCQGKHVVGYNVQGVVDAKHHLLVVTEVSQEASDQGQLAPMARAAKEELEIQSAEALADGGYYKSEDIKACQEMGMEPLLPEVNNSPSERAGLYGKADFRYDAQTDVMICPASANLPLQRSAEDKGRTVFHYSNRAACAGCKIRAQCTKGPFRTVTRWEHEECLERMTAKVEASAEKMAMRKTLIEHCWGTLKWLLPGGFLVRGLQKVRAEVSLAHFAYNLKRALSVVGLDGLMAIVNGRIGSAKAV